MRSASAEDSNASEPYGIGVLYLTGDAEADKLLTEDPLALLIGMVLDQQIAKPWSGQ